MEGLKAISVQLGWLFATRQELSASSLYRQITGTDPWTATNGGLPDGLTSVAFGSPSAFPKAKLSVEVRAAQRVDVVVSAEDDSPETIALLSNAESILHDVVRITQPVSSTLHNVYRQTLIAKMATIWPSRSEANQATIRRLSGVSPALETHAGDLFDLVLTFNNRGRFAFDSSVEMNRILRVASEVYSKVTLQAFGAAPMQFEVPVSAVDFDLNVVPKLGRIFDSDQQRTVHLELMAQFLKHSQLSSIDAFFEV